MPDLGLPGTACSGPVFSCCFQLGRLILKLNDSNGESIRDFVPPGCLKLYVLIFIKESKPLRHHREVSYESSRPQALSVSKKGVIKAKKKGKYTVFAYAQSGVYRKVQITVK